MQTLTPVSRVALSEQVAGQLATKISHGAWKPGDKLPSESQLCEALRIGRSTLREALRSLSFVGLVVMKAGEGTYVRSESTELLQKVFSQGVFGTPQDVDDLGNRACGVMRCARLKG
jgi:GntR family transcriptional repressor for pyruvate dehydrogenase complex